MALKVSGNVAIVYGGDTLTTHLNTSSLAQVVNAIDVTNFGSTGTQSIAGLPTITVPIGGQWSKTLDGYLAVDAVTPPATLNALIVTIGAAGSTVVYTWSPGTATYGAFITDYNIDMSSPTEGIMWSATLTCSGIPVRTTP
jgi:hypothetical protein